MKINPLDFKKNTAIGVSIPFSGNAVFNSTYYSKDQIKNNLINMLLTNPNERIFNPQLGIGINKYIFEQITSDTLSQLETLISTNINLNFPQISTKEIIISSNPDNNNINISISYMLGDQTTDSVSLNFENNG